MKWRVLVGCQKGKIGFRNFLFSTLPWFLPKKIESSNYSIFCSASFDVFVFVAKITAVFFLVEKLQFFGKTAGKNQGFVLIAFLKTLENGLRLASLISGESAHVVSYWQFSAVVTLSSQASSTVTRDMPSALFLKWHSSCHQRNPSDG